MKPGVIIHGPWFCRLYKLYLKRSYHTIHSIWSGFINSIKSLIFVLKIEHITLFNVRNSISGKFSGKKQTDVQDLSSMLPMVRFVPFCVRNFFPIIKISQMCVLHQDTSPPKNWNFVKSSPLLRSQVSTHFSKPYMDCWLSKSKATSKKTLRGRDQLLF